MACKLDSKKESIKDVYISGTKLSEMAKIFSCSRATMDNYVRANFERRKKPGRIGVITLKEEKIKHLHEKGKTPSEISEILGLSRISIAGLFRRRNIKPCKKEYWKGKTGAESIAGKRGILRTNDVDTLRKCSKMVVFRNNVFRRDCFACLWCGKHGGYLEAHHIIPFRDCFKNFGLLYGISNGITLCKRCHKKTINKEYEFVQLFKELIKDIK